MSFAKHHDELAAAVAPHKGVTLSAKQIRQLFQEKYPHLDVKWVQPSDHCVDHTCKGACDCAETERAIFSRPKWNTYVVL